MKRALDVAALLLPLLAALALYGPGISRGSFLDDDILLNFVLERGDPPRVAWDEVLKDFGRPVVGIRGSPLYRPLVSLSYAVDFALGGVDPRVYHATNVAAFAASVLLCGALAALLARERPRAAALLAGTLFAVHPLAVEPVCWLAARNAGIGVAFQLAALVAFARHRRGGRGRDLALCAAASAGALATMESGAVLPALLLAVDACAPVELPLARRLRAHLALAPLWVAYFAVRRLALGVWLASDAPLGDGALLPALAQRMRAALLPGDALGAAHAPLALLLALALAAGLADRRARWTLVALAGALVAALLPSGSRGVGPGPLAMRYAYAGAAVVAVGAAVLTCGGRIPRGRGRGGLPLALPGLVLGAAALPGLAGTTRAWIALYEHAWAVGRTSLERLPELARDATPERPLAVFYAPRAPGAWMPYRNVFALTELPLAPEDRPLAFVEPVWTVLRGGLELERSTAEPLRAFVEAGSRTVGWDYARGTWAEFDLACEAARRRRAGAVADLALEPEGEGRFRFAAGPVPSFELEAVEVVLDGPAEGATLAWEPGHPEFAPVPLAGGVALDGGGRRVLVDLSDSVALIACSPLTALVVRGGAAREVRALARLPELPLPARLDGRALSRAELERDLVAPELPPDAGPGGELELVLAGPATRFAFPVRPGAPVVLPDAVRWHAEGIVRASRQRLFWLWFRTRPSPGLPARRSALDRFRLVPETEG